MNEVERIYADGERGKKEDLKHTYPIRSRIPRWLEENLLLTHNTLVEQHKWRPHEHALAMCKQQGLDQQAYFLQRDLAFMREVILSKFALSSKINNYSISAGTCFVEGTGKH